MTTVIIGAGAIGLLIAGRLSQSVSRIALLARPSFIENVKTHGIFLEQDDTKQPIDQLTVVGHPEEITQQHGSVEMAIVCVKGYDTVGTLETLAKLKPKHVLTLQNGIGNEEILIKHFGHERVLSGAITTSVEVETPGHIRITKSGGVGLAPIGEHESIQTWRSYFTKATFDVHIYQDYRAMKWSKALINILGNATAAILDMPAEVVYAHQKLVVLERQAFLEALQVMDRLAIAPVNLPRYRVALLARAMRYTPLPILHPILRRLVADGRGGKPPSLHLELLRGNQRSEGESLYGAIAHEAQKCGVSAPVNQGLWKILQGIATQQIDWNVYRRQPDKLIAAIKP
ncbi:MAG: ketopantoate reductase family protein [Chloroflexi bacterium AL-W]|nr:ketopantoate reductase family protein [Chloroflexi bacterium AL-N1]NOK65714.1 ketopantoate reductase family protein [Chloroflexi bacterium AL-N10]NOK74345.1 ketopantoate reductase family protein [Chloroflexi bacterium AL-N5]NOK80747.1 ketopantoate reductase family protein [Chloroflexi bacterium AL-W]NOK88603.1 ketopantoate reductase family protein [Chloroflexi bacterium AL-N15]